MRIVSWILAVAAISFVSVPSLPGEDAKQATGSIRAIRVIKANRAKIRGLEFSQDGKQLLTTVDGQLVLWDPSTGKELRRVGVEKNSISGVAYTCQGRKIVSAINPRCAVQFFDAATLKLGDSVELHQPINNLTASPRGNIVAASLEGKILLIDAPSAKIQQTIVMEKNDFAQHLAFSPDDRTLAFSLHNTALNNVRQELVLYDLSTGKQIRKLPLPTTAKERPERLSKWPGRIAFSEATGLFALGMQSDLVLPLWDVNRPTALRQLDWTFRLSREDLEADRIPDKRVEALRFSRDGKTLIVACGDCKVRFWEPTTAKLRYTVDLQAYQLALSPDGSILATDCPSEKAIRLWDWRDIGTRRLEVTADSLPRLWDDLASEDAAVRFRAVSSLLAEPKLAVESIAKRLIRIEPVGEDEVKRFIAKLDADKFEVRDGAMRRLEVLGRIAESALRDAAKASPSVEARGSIAKLLARLEHMGAEKLRMSRSVEVLEAIGSMEARKVLERLAGGAVRADLTVDAKAALARLSKRSK